tara:strand:- start:289 stop:1890 length:1602 start_codon:yes stop_codon:yes gene_type:complete
MSNTQTFNFNLNSNIKGATRDAKGFKNEMDEVNKEAKGAISNFTFMGVSLNGVRAAMGRVIPMAKMMFGTIKAGLISTGIGALLVAFGSLVSFLTNTQRGAVKLKKAFEGIGAIANVLIDRFSTLGEGLSMIFFEGKFSEGAKLLQDAFKGIADEAKTEVKVMMDLVEAREQLRKDEDAFIEQKAKTRQAIEKARLAAEDETKSAEERLKQLKRSLELEKQATAEELRMAKLRRDHLELELEQSENLAEDERNLAEAKAAVTEVITAQARLRRRVITEVNALERELAADREQRAKEEMDRLKEMNDKQDELLKDYRLSLLTEQQREIAEVMDKYADIIKATQEYYDKLSEEDKKHYTKHTELVEAREGTIQQIKDKYRLQEQAKNKVASKDTVELAEETTADQAAALGTLATAMAGLANDNKGLAVAGAIMSTYAGANKALEQGGMVGPVAAAAIILQGLSNVRRIMEVDIPGGGGTTGGSMANTEPTTEMFSGNFNLTGTQAEQPPLQAFVLTDEMTSSQNQLANIRRRATI